MRHFVGMDLHSTNTVIGIIDGTDAKKFSRKVPNNLNLILQVLLPYQSSISGIVIESTYNWYWLADGLMDAGYKVHLANPCAIQQYKGLKYTNDKHDAYWLATLLKLGILPEGYIHSRADRQLRDLLRKRLMLVRQRTQHILSFSSLMNRNLCQRMSSNIIKVLKESDIDDYISEHHLKMSAKANIASMNFLRERIKILEKEILSIVKIKWEYEKLLTVPGIGKALALTILLETGNINRFRTVGDFASYCRCVPSKRISNNKNKGQNNRKNGNKYLAWAFVETANFCKRYSPAADFFFKKKSHKTNKIIAIKALAHKLSRACYYIMKDKVNFDAYKLFNIPVTNKGCSSEPVRGLNCKSNAPIGPTAAAAKN